MSLIFEMKHVKGKENKVEDALSIKFHVVVVNVCQIDLRTRILEALPYDKVYLQVKEELGKDPHSKRYKDYRIGKDGILMCGRKMYILYDACSETYDSAHVTKSNERDRGHDHDHAGDCNPDSAKDFDHAKL